MMDLDGSGDGEAVTGGTVLWNSVVLDVVCVVVTGADVVVEFWFFNQASNAFLMAIEPPVVS